MIGKRKTSKYKSIIEATVQITVDHDTLFSEEELLDAIADKHANNEPEPEEFEEITIPDRVELDGEGKVAGLVWQKLPDTALADPSITQEQIDLLKRIQELFGLNIYGICVSWRRSL